MQLEAYHDEEEKDKAIKKVLKRAQDVYGVKNQMAVAAEECCELAMLCNKYQRYSSHGEFTRKLRNKLVSEVADVIICLNHLTLMFDITDEEKAIWINAKIERLNNWLETSADIQYTTEERELTLPEEVRE